MKYKKKEIKQYIPEKLCSVTKVALAFVLVTDTYKTIT